MPRILLVEDETDIADTVRYALETAGFGVDHAPTAGEAESLASAGRHELAILDIGLPDVDGLELCRRLRRHRDLPVIFLTAQAGEIDRILGLELGADDYVTKPFSPRELVARVRVVLRRGQRQAEPPSRAGGFEHDLAGRRIRYRGQLLDLTRYEYGLLAALLQRPGAVLSRGQLMDRVWGDALESGDRTVDTHVKTLRAKLRSAAGDAEPDAIRTHRGLGYSLDVEAGSD